MLSILFLDFDGVLSPGNTGTLRYANDLATLLERHPHVRVVLTTNWRALESFAELKQWLPAALADKVVDAAPMLPGGECAGGRQMEIEAWLAQHPAKF